MDFIVRTQSLIGNQSKFNPAEMDAEFNINAPLAIIIINMGFWDEHMGFDQNPTLNKQQHLDSFLQAFNQQKLGSIHISAKNLFIEVAKDDGVNVGVVYNDPLPLKYLFDLDFIEFTYQFFKESGLQTHSYSAYTPCDAMKVFLDYMASKVALNAEYDDQWAHEINALIENQSNQFLRSLPCN